MIEAFFKICLGKEVLDALVLIKKIKNNQLFTKAGFLVQLISKMVA